MVERYFEKFPITNYSNNNVVDITKRSTLLNNVYNNPYVFYPYEIINERADQLSYRYYGDQFQSWILYLSNKIMDPYYEWYLNDSEFNNFIISKYETFEMANIKVKFFRNNWHNQENIAKNYFDALIPSVKKYWEPVYGYDNQITSYKRSEKNWVINTNEIVSYTAITNLNVSEPFFTNDEICYVNYNGSIGRGQVLSVSNTNVYLHNVFGNFINTGSGYITGSESGANVSFSVANTIAVNISAEEYVYWEPVTYYQYEIEKNEYNKTLNVIDKTYSQKISDDLKTLMNE